MDGFEGIFWRSIQQDLDVDSEGDENSRKTLRFWLEHVGG